MTAKTIMFAAIFIAATLVLAMACALSANSFAKKTCIVG
jgi:hypothetical protein